MNVHKHLHILSSKPTIKGVLDKDTSPCAAKNAEALARLASMRTLIESSEIEDVVFIEEEL